MKRGILATILVVAGVVAAGQATAVDIPVAGKKLVLKTNTVKGTSLAKLILKDPAIAFGGAGSPAVMSATLEIQYVATANQTSISMPAPWLLNNGFLARYKNSDAPAGPSLVKSAILQAGRIAKVTSKGIGTLNITGAPPAGIRTVLSINNNGLTRLCTQWSVVTHKVLATGNRITTLNGTPTACPPLPTCFDGIQNQNETCIDGGGVCVAGCNFGSNCVLNSDCNVGTSCVGGTCKCDNHLFTFTVNSNNGGAFDSAEWPGGTQNQQNGGGCGVTINNPANNIDLVCSLSDRFSVSSSTGFSSCNGTGGEDGDGCQPVSCPFAGVGSCCTGRPSCSVATNGSASAQYFVQCLQ